MTKQTVTAATPAESRNACASLKVGDKVRCPGVSEFTFTVVDRVLCYNGDVALRIHGEGATLPGWLYPNGRNDKVGFEFCPFVGGKIEWIPEFEIAA